jgi:hypothetical protein
MGGNQRGSAAAFSVAESLTEGITLVLRRPSLAVPFIFAALVGSLPLWILRFSLGEDLLSWFIVYSAPASFLLGMMAWLIGAWGTWLVIGRYQSQGIANGGDEDTLQIDALADFLSRKNPVRKALIYLSLIFASLSVVQQLVSTVFSGLGPSTVTYYGTMAPFWVLRLVLVFAVFGVLVHRESASKALGLSRGMASKHLLQTAGLAIGVTLAGGIMQWGLGWLLWPIYLLLDVSGAGTQGILIVGTMATMPLVGAIRASCFCYAFFSAFRRVDRVTLAVKHGKAVKTCSGSPTMGECQQCRQLQNYGDKLYCTRFGKAVLKH